MLLGLPTKVWSYSVVGTAPALLKEGGDLPKALCLFQEHSLALIIPDNQVILKMRVSPLALQHLSLFLQWLGAHHATIYFPSPRPKPTTNV